MILYEAKIDDFYSHVRGNEFADILKGNFKNYFGHNPSVSECNSFQNSSQYVKNILEEAKLKDNHICFEYQIPYSTGRIDCMIFGKSVEDKSYAFLLELKQWSIVKEVEDEDNFIETYTGGGLRKIPHPSDQVEGYHNHLKNYIKIFELDSNFNLYSCSYCHNYTKKDGGGLFAPQYNSILEKFPIYTKKDVKILSGKLSEYLSAGSGTEIFNRFMQSPVEPSKKLLENTAKIIKGEKSFSLLNEQLIAKNVIISKLKKSEKSDKKSVIVVHGGPGTGKSVIAFNLLAELGVRARKNNVRYACKSKPFIEAIRATVGKESRELFVNLDVFAPTLTKENDYDVILVDEAHRIAKKSGHQFTPKEHRTDMPQVEQLVRAGKVSVFFIDDKQNVRGREVGSSKLLKEAAEKYNADFEEVTLASQFRCNGSDGYLLWLDSVLGYTPENKKLGKNDNFDFKIVDSPEKLYSSLLEKEIELKKPNSARLVAGFCWPWSQKLAENGELVKDVKIGKFEMPWETHGKVKPPKGYVKWYEWAYKPDGIKQVGCIYTVQGFEFEYIGVIIGDDLIYDSTTNSLIGNITGNCDPTLKHNKVNFTTYARNIYRVLLSRGMKGCYVYFTNKEVEKYFRERINI